MLRSLQAGRAIAAIAVAAFHLSSAYEPGVSFFADHTRHGSAGVGFFFVLSGFIILYAHEADVGRPQRLGRYLRNRFVRVYPVYWLYTSAFVAAVLAAGGSTLLPSDAGGWFATVSLIRLTDTHTPLSVTWTLFYEVAFYAVFGVLILNRMAGLITMTVWLMVILGIHQYAERHSPGGVWSSILCLNFFIGMAACKAHRLINGRQGILPVLAGLAGLMWTGAWVDKTLSDEAFQLLIGVNCGFIVMGFASLERSVNLRFGMLEVIGDASYTLYLIHVHVGIQILSIVQRTGAWQQLHPDVNFVLIMGGTVAIACATYWVVERPLVHRVKAYLQPMPAVAA